MKQVFLIGGMSCVNCALGIEKGLSAVDGVLDVKVSLIDKECTVEFNQDKIDEKTIKSIINKLGYTAKIKGSERVDKFSDAIVLKKRFFISLSLLIPLTYLCLSKTLGLPNFTDKINFCLQLVLASVILVINRVFFIKGIKAVLNGSPSMDTLVALGSSSAYIYSVVATILTLIGQSVSHTFFDGSCMVVTLVTLGKYLEELSKIKTGDAIEKLSTLLPDSVTVIENGAEKIISASKVKVGDIVLVKAGEYLSVDGVVIDGVASVDKSAITGESMPVDITEGSSVSSGSIVINGYLKIRAEKVGEQTLFSEIIKMVKSAGASKAPIQRLADKVAKYFVPIVVSIAIIVGVFWYFISYNIAMALNYLVDVLVISCPCALGLATPVAVMASMGNSARHGILFKDAESLQKASKIDYILLDKTATITVGKPKVINYLNLSSLSDNDVFLIARSLEQNSSHPLAKSIVEFCKADGVKVSDYEYVIGKGVSGKVFGEKYYIGSPSFLSGKIDLTDADELSKEYLGKTIIYLASSKEVLAIFALSDYVKEDSASAIKLLQEKGAEVVMITGDNALSASAIAKEVGISYFKDSVLPNKKADIVSEYQSKGYFTVMVGDGINDAPSLKQADLGVAIGTGTDIAIDSADVILSNGSLLGLVKMIDIGKRSMMIIKQNLFWAFFYNLLSIPLASGALSFLGVTLTPMIASICMCISSLFVVTNALRLRGKEKLNKRIKGGKIEQITLKIDNMMCNHCVDKVSKALNNLNGVESVNVNLKTKTATINTQRIIIDAELIDLLKNIGFTVIEISRIKT